jgi:hypothetical protein
MFVEHFFSDKEVFVIDQQISQSGCIGFHIFTTQGLLCCVKSMSAMLCGINDVIISPSSENEIIIVYF